MNNSKSMMVIMVLTLIVMVVGSTFAFWTWQSSSAQKTNITLTMGNDFSCSADGGGNITSSQKTLAPAACTNSTYAIQRNVVVSTTQTQGKTIALDLWLKVNNIGSGLTGSHNFKYALTTDSSSCTSGVVASGDFYGTGTGSELLLLDDEEYSQTTAADTYYLYIWLDSQEDTSSTQDQNFNITIGGFCTDELS